MREGGSLADDGSPEPSIEKVTGTTRKCANCGQVGHIKTNKKYVCPCSPEEASESREVGGGGGGPAAGSKPAAGGAKKKRSYKKRSAWRPTAAPREGDKFWDPRCWDAGAFEATMEVAPGRRA